LPSSAATALGELLVQAAPGSPGRNDSWLLWDNAAAGPPPFSEIESSGPVALLPPRCGELIVPEQGKAWPLRTPAAPAIPAAKVLPGSPESQEFSVRWAGRALLVRHWPDFRRFNWKLVETRPREPRLALAGREGLVLAPALAQWRAGSGRC